MDLNKLKHLLYTDIYSGIRANVSNFAEGRLVLDSLLCLTSPAVTFWVNK